MSRHSAQPSIIHARMAGASSHNFSDKPGSRSLGGMVTVNGVRLSRARIAASTDFSDGLWLPAIASLKYGVNVNGSWRMKFAVIGSPPSPT